MFVALLQHNLWGLPTIGERPDIPLSGLTRGARVPTHFQIAGDAKRAEHPQPAAASRAR